MNVSATKSAIVASTKKLTKKVARKIKTGKVAVANTAKMLGTITTSGRARSVKMLASRFKSTKVKSARAQKLRRSGVNTGVWTRTAGIPGLMYEADVTGIGDTMLKQQRSVISFAATAPSAGKKPYDGFVVNGVHG